MPPEKIHFTKKAICDLEPLKNGERRSVYDTKISGLLVLVMPTGTKTFQVRKSVQSKTVRITLGRFPHMTVEQARAAALRELATIATTHQTSAQQQAERREYAAFTLGKAFADYLAAHRHLKQSTVEDYQKAAKNGWQDWLELPLNKITRAMVQERHATRSQTSAARANNEMRVLRGVFNYATNEYRDKNDKPLITENPVYVLSHNKAWNRVERRKSYIKAADMPVWFAAVNTLPSWYAGELAAKARAYFLLTLFHGYRRSETARLCWEDIDFQQNSIVINDTKNHDKHLLPLASFTRELLHQWQQESGNTSGLVFRATDNNAALNHVEAVIAAITERTGIKWTMHDLRRTFTTTAENLGITGYTLKRLLNHRSDAGDVTAGYIVTDLEAMREPMQRIADKLLSNASAKLPTDTTANTAAATKTRKGRVTP